jgi:hypothetical protein
LNNGKEVPVLTDEQILEWHLDSDIVSGLKDKGDGNNLTGEERTKAHNKEPLLVNTSNSWSNRPNSFTDIPNLFLASDYVRTFTDLATMEGANEAARRAVNNILDVSRSKEKPCELWNLHEPDILSGLRAHDQERYNKGLQWEPYETPGMKIFAAILKPVISAIRWLNGIKKIFKTKVK